MVERDEITPLVYDCQVCGKILMSTYPEHLRAIIAQHEISKKHQELLKKRE